MHPEVLADKPGACPTSGMALEPVDLSATTDRVEYTCPMHPQIVRFGPGPCPIRGMALEPRNVSADTANPELLSMTRRFWIGGGLFKVTEGVYQVRGFSLCPKEPWS